MPGPTSPTPLAPTAKPKAPEVLDHVPRTLAELHLDEAWLEKWLQEKPKRLGLGPHVRIVRAQVHRPTAGGAGRLDIQAVDEALEDRVYDVELMRGPLDADHGFRALDYWARESKADDQDREHRPVVVAERIRGTRWWVLLEALAEKLGLIALEVRCIEVDGKPVVWLEPVLLPEDLQPDRSGEVRAVKGSATEDEWRAKTTKEFQSFLDTFTARVKGWGMAPAVVWSARSYIGLWRGSRCWCPIWPRKEAAGRIYLPAPAHWGEGGEEAPPPEFAETAAELEKLGVELVWTWTYNAGSNPLALTVRAEHLERPEVRALLEASWKGLD